MKQLIQTSFISAPKAKDHFSIAPYRFPMVTIRQWPFHSWNRKFKT